MRAEGASERYSPAMRTYYFNVVNDDVTDDFEGTELADDEAARAYATAAARSLAGETVSKGHLTRSHRVVIQNAQREEVGEVRFDEAVEIRD